MFVFNFYNVVFTGDCKSLKIYVYWLKKLELSQTAFKSFINSILKSNFVSSPEKQVVKSNKQQFRIIE